MLDLTEGCQDANADPSPQCWLDLYGGISLPVFGADYAGKRNGVDLYLLLCV